MSRGFIYLIVNQINRKCYVGKTVTSIVHRFAQHKCEAKAGRALALYSAIRKYGSENFSVCEIACCDVLLLNDLEKHFIKFYGSRTFEHGYNETEGGEGSSGWRASAETRRRLSESHRGQIAWNKGKSFTAAHRAHISAALKGRKLPEETIAKMRLNRVGMKGKHHSEETKEKIRNTKAAKKEMGR